MTSGFPHQSTLKTAALPRTDALPQHGQKPDRRCMEKASPDRKPTPRPGH
jgi:hypothetical protein